MSQEKRDTEESKSQEQDVQSEEKESKNQMDSGSVQSDAASSPSQKTGTTEEKSVKKEESAEDFLKDDVDDLPEDIKKKLEKKKTDKSSKKTGVKKRKKKKTRGKVSVGKAFVKATYNNTIVTITDLNGEVISWASAGVAGFKGPKKSTPYASQIITKIATMKAKQDYGLKEVSVFVKGVGMGRESAIRTLNAQGLFVTSIKDVTPVPHNGCRPKKPRRV